MAKSQLMQRWVKYKARRRKTQPKAFANKASGNLNRFAMRDYAVFRGHDRVGNTDNVKRLEHYINTRKPHHRILYMLFGANVKKAEAVLKNDLKMACDLLMDRYAMQDPTLEAFKFDCITLGSSHLHLTLMFFRGRECFLVHKVHDKVQLSIMYWSTNYLKSLSLKQVEWAGEPVYLDKSDSLSVHELLKLR